MAVKREYRDGGSGAEVSRSTTCLLQLLDAVTNDHIFIAATNLIEDVDSAIKRRFTEIHEMHRLSADDREKFIIQYLNDTGFKFDSENVRTYSLEDYSQAEIMTHMTRNIAKSMIDKSEMVIL